MKSTRLWTGVKLAGVGVIIIASVMGCGKKDDDTAATNAASAPAPAATPAK